MESLSRYGKVVIGLCFGVWAGIVAFIVISESRFPGTDVFLFKEAAVNFALKSRLVASNLVYMPLDQEMPFAHYPPVYPTVFGLWMKLFGIGLKQSLLFECLLRGLRTVILGALIWPSLKSAFNQKNARIWAALASVLLLFISIASTDDDRPDELGLVIGLSSWWILLRAKEHYQFLLVGLLLGLTGATSPACSVAIGLGILSYFFLSVKRLKPLLLLSLGAVLSFFCCIGPVLLAHGEVLKRFSISAQASSVPYTIPGFKGVTWAKFFNRMQYCMNHYFSLGFKLIFCFFSSVSLSLLMRERSQFKIHPFQASSIVFAFVAPFIWSLQPYYLWFAVLPLAIFFLAEQLRKEQSTRVLAFVGVFVAFFPLFFHEAKIFISVIHQPQEEKSSFVRERLLEKIKPEERIAVSPDQFFTLRNYREIANVSFVCHALSKFDYVYVTRMWSSKQGHPAAVPIPCWSVSEVSCFEPVENFSKNYPLIIAGWNTGYITRGNGGTLYRNTRCTERAPHHVASGFSNQF